MSSIGIFLVPAIVILVLVWLARSGARTTRLSADDHQGDAEHEFRIKTPARVLMCISPLFGVLFIGMAAFGVVKSGDKGWLLLFGLPGFLWAVGTTYFAVRMSRARVFVGPLSVRGFWPGVRFELTYEEIKSVSRVGLGSVVIEPFAGKTFEILQYFDNTHDIWRLISERLPSRQDIDHQNEARHGTP